MPLHPIKHSHQIVGFTVHWHASLSTLLVFELYGTVKFSVHKHSNKFYWLTSELTLASLPVASLTTNMVWDILILSYLLASVAWMHYQLLLVVSSVAMHQCSYGLDWPFLDIGQHISDLPAWSRNASQRNPTRSQIQLHKTPAGFKLQFESIEEWFAQIFFIQHFSLLNFHNALIGLPKILHDKVCDCLGIFVHFQFFSQVSITYTLKSATGPYFAFVCGIEFE